MVTQSELLKAFLRFNDLTDAKMLISISVSVSVSVSIVLLISVVLYPSIYWRFLPPRTVGTALSF